MGKITDDVRRYTATLRILYSSLSTTDSNEYDAQKTLGCLIIKTTIFD